jgi:hypothetical protein
MIQAFADRYGVTVDVVGSRAAGTATAASDFDYVITGGNSAVRRAARTELPRGTAGGELRSSGAESGRDIFNGNITPTDTSRPYIRFVPLRKGIDNMIKIEIESFSSSTNAAVIRLPGRKFPALVLQGDSLKILMDEAHEVARLSRRTNISELVDAADHLAQLLGEYLRHYEEALKKHGESLPY